MIIRQQITPLLLLLACFGTGCALLDDSTSKKPAPTGLIATPPSYYSTAKARYLGTKYKDNLDRLAERILRNPSTSQLQFANNISSVGGIGFFTHSATKTADERYLEVVLATPETFETKGEYSEKVNQLVSRYGQELLGLLAGDTQIYQDKELTGYGLNLTWRTVLSEPPTNRITMARAIIYLQKEKVAGFLRRDLAQAELLRDAVIFAVEEDGPLNLVSYQPRETKPDFRPAIHEDTLAAATAELKQSTLLLPSEVAKEAVQKNEAKVEPVKKEAAVAQDAKARGAVNKPSPIAERPEAKAPIAAAQKERATLAPLVENVKITGEKSSPAKRDAVAEKFALAKPSAKVPPATITPEAKPEAMVAPKLTPEEPERVPAAKETAEAVTEKVSETTASPFPTKPESSAKAPNGKPVARRSEEIQTNAAKTAGQVKKIEPKLEPTKQTEKAAPPALALKPIPNVKTKAVEEIKKQESVLAPATVAPLPASGPAVEEIAAAPVPAVVLESRKPVVKSAPFPLVSAPRESEHTPKTSASPTAPAPEAKTREAEKPRADVASAAAKVSPLRETKPADSAAAPLPAAKAAMPIIAPEPAKSLEVKKNEAAPGRAEKLPDTAAARKIDAPAPEVAKVPQVKVPAVAAVRTTTPESAALRKIETPTSEIAKPSEGKAPAVPAVRLSAEKAPEVASVRKVETAAPLPVAKVEQQTTKPAPMPSIVATLPEKVADKSAPEQLALLRKPPEPTIEKKPLARQAPRSLEGFIIQIAFNDKERAQSWAEKMEQRGYAVSVTEAGAQGSLRVRLGNFSVRDEAERQLRNFKQEGMNGIIINLPQAFRPEARSSVP
jgi:cell division protein FtsN